MCRSEPQTPVASTRTTASSRSSSSGSGRSSTRTSPGAWKVTACIGAPARYRVAAREPARSTCPTAGRLVPSELTRGPWDPGAQHAGPPSALLGTRARALRAARRDAGRAHHGRDPRARAARAAHRRGAVVRPGRSVELLEATLAGPGRRGDAGQRLAASRTRAMLEPPPPPDPPPPGPERGRARASSSPRARRSATTRRWSTASCAAASWSRARRIVWMRMRGPLVEGEDPTAAGARAWSSPTSATA